MDKIHFTSSDSCKYILTFIDTSRWGKPVNRIDIQYEYFINNEKRVGAWQIDLEDIEVFFNTKFINQDVKDYFGPKIRMYLAFR